MCSLVWTDFDEYMSDKPPSVPTLTVEEDSDEDSDSNSDSESSSESSR